jgi:hypothetical protein
MSLVTENMVFIHIPKTGGSYVRHVLKTLNLVKKEIGPPHDPVFKIKPHVKEKTFFCTIRDPVKWVFSVWGDWMDDDIHRKNNIRRLKEGNDWSTNQFSRQIVEFIKPDMTDTFKCIIQNYPGFVSSMYTEYIKGCEIVLDQSKLSEQLYDFLKEKNNLKVDYNYFMQISRKRVSKSSKNIIVDESILKEFRETENAYYKGEL